MGYRQGFSLVETVVLIGIFGLMTALALPAVSNYIRTNQLDTSTDRLAADLHMARTLSVSNGRVYQLAATTTGYRLVDTSTGGVIRNSNFAGAVRLAAGDTVSFFPWGMADAAVFNLQCDQRNRSVTLLPTGVVEVN
jgi:type II secretion system protein H